MTEVITVTIDGRKIQAAPHTTILEAARGAHIDIPTLCYNESLTPYGACRLCMVEITEGKRTRLVASCIYEISEGLVVETDTPRVKNVRRLVMELLLARNPKHPALLAMASRVGVFSSRFPAEVKGCILCGQCVRACREVVGVSAIGFAGRGVHRKVTTPFGEAPPDCIACGSCAYVCPVDVIRMEQKDGVRRIWNTDFEMVRCEDTGRYIAPKKQLEYVSRITGLSVEHLAARHCR